MKSKKNKTSFKPGHKRTPEQIEKQRQTIKAKIAAGHRDPPRNPWTEDSKAKMIASLRKVNLRKKPIGTKKKHNAGKSGKDLFYWVVKVSDRGKWQYEHRLVMAGLLGRPLTEKEHVHHVNGDTLDNRPENIELYTHSCHSTHHGKEQADRVREMGKAKSLPPGEWSSSYDCCVICHTNSVKHVSKGRCNNCYARLYRRGKN